jgi:hypothetical protein
MAISSVAKWLKWKTLFHKYTTSYRLQEEKNTGILLSMNTQPAPPKKRGPVPKGYEDTHVLMPPDLLRWAKEQPEGLAGLVRDLLAKERARRTPVGA